MSLAYLKKRNSPSGLEDQVQHGNPLRFPPVPSAFNIETWLESRANVPTEHAELLSAVDKERVESWVGDMRLRSSGTALKFLRHKFPSHADVVVVEDELRQPVPLCKATEEPFSDFSVLDRRALGARMLEQGVRYAIRWSTRGGQELI